MNDTKGIINFCLLILGAIANSRLWFTLEKPLPATTPHNFLNWICKTLTNA
ncbi:hypothetical protein ACF3DV_31690 [Chlorogloeopsis fritschii PCC 9212]|uniref:hypothetical protein n=1 Tax=Chlorogloeopsis fritschii TaxID=1124 RepID=UPI0003001412|nr:hypothetical protein [Chlorogloeopsis fritschii]MBF2005208.1 hypothetical protein [Chlorogloeopsis fritschii C42_A2020_084]